MTFRKRPNPRRCAVFLIVVLPCLSAASVQPLETVEGPAENPDAPRGGSKIVFQSERDGNMEIYIMNADGSEPVRLTDHPAEESYPAWSPLGDKIVFVSDREGNGDIYLISPDGSGLERLTSHPAEDSAPRWTADGQRIVFTSSRGAERGPFIMNADGTDVRRIPPESWIAISPGSSPDSTMVAVERDGGTDWNFEEAVQRGAESSAG